MDFTSYCNITSLFITKTIDRIISPMAVQLCHLVIALECDGSKYTGTSCDLEQMAEELSKATEHFANTSVRLGKECDDGILRQEMEQASKSLLITGKNILLSVQKLCIQPTVQKHQADLISAAQNILTGTLKILQLEDDAGVRKINEAVNWLLECLHYLEKAESIPHLLTHFCEFSEALLLVNSLMERRIVDIKDALHQHHLSETLQTLRKCVPMLYTATQSNIKHPHNEQMITSKLYIFDLTSKTLQELKCLLKNGPAKQELNKKQGSFSQEMSRLLKLLSTSNLKEINSSDLDFLVGAVVFYSMYVADCSRPNIKLQLVKHCQHLLEKRKKLCDYLNEIQESSGLGNIHCQLQKQCESIKVELNDLCQLLVSTIFYQILDAFTVKDPLKRLLKTALKNNKKATLHPQNLIATRSFQLLQAFQNHTEHLLKISCLVLAQCSQERNVEEIQNSVDFLCRVRDEVVEFIIDNKPYNKSRMFENAQYIYQKWIQATESLMVSFDSMLTVQQFLDLSIKEIDDNRKHCEKLLRSQEPEIFQHHGADLCDLAERLCQVINRHVDQSKEPIFRNGLRVLVRQLERSVLETREAIMNCVESISCVVTQKSFLEKINKLFECIYSVNEGVSGCNHPDLLSPLRTEVVPVGYKPIKIDLNELDQVKESNFENSGEPTKCLSYEGYLSKPLPLTSSPRELVNSIVNTENTEQISSPHPLVGDLLSAVKQLNMKNIKVCSSSVIEISSVYLGEIKECLPQVEMSEKDKHRYKEVESLILSLTQLTKEGSTDSVTMGRLIQTAVLLSHYIVEIKTHLVSFGSFWHSFSHQLFCTSTNSNYNANIQIFNAIMQHVSKIVQSLSEHLISDHDDLNFPTYSEKQASLLKIHVKFSKCQAVANQLLTKVLCFKIQPDTQKLEDICIQWSVAVQHLSKCVDDFIGIDDLIISESIDMTELKLSEGKNLILLCEVSLWLQEASALSVQTFTKEEDQKTVGLLKEDVDVLIESLLEVRDELSEPKTNTKPAMFLNIECVLLQTELILKAKLLMYHLKKMYNGKHTLAQRMVNVALSKSNDKSLIRETFENEAKLLVGNLTLLKDTLSTSLCLEGKHDVAFLVDHLFFLTGDLVARSRLLIDNHNNWEMFIVNAMSLNWLSKADQLISHLQRDADLDALTLISIKECLEMCEGMENQIPFTPTVLENVKSDTSIQSMTIKMKESSAGKETEKKCSSHRGQNESYKQSCNAIYEQIESCGDDNSEINDSDKVNLENRLKHKQQSTDVRKECMELNKEPKSTVKRSIKVFSAEHEMVTQAKHDKPFIQEQSKIFSVALQQTTTAESDEKVSVCEVSREHLEMTNQKTQMKSEVNSVQTVVTPQAAKKEITRRESSRIKRQTLPGESQKEASNLNSKIQRTYTKSAGMQKQTSNQQSRNQRICTESEIIKKEAADLESCNQEAYAENTRVKKDVSNQESRSQSIHTESKKTQKEATNQESSNQLANAENTTIQKGASNQESIKHRTLTESRNSQKQPSTHGAIAENTRMQKDTSSHGLINQKAHSEGIALLPEIKESNFCKMHTEVSEGYNGTNQGSRNQKGLSECSNVIKNITSQESLKQKPHKIIPGSQKEKANQVSKNHEQQHITLYQSHKETTSQEQKNPKGPFEFTGLQKKIVRNKSKNQKIHTVSEGHTELIHEELQNKEKEISIQGLLCHKMDTVTVEEHTEKYCKESPFGKFYSPISLGKTKTTNLESPTKQTHMTLTTVVKNTINKELKVPKAESFTKSWIDGKKTLLMTAEHLRKTSVFMERQKVSHTSLEDIRWQPRKVTTCVLDAEVETWEGENNSVIKVTREMAAQMSYMIQYLNKKGPIQVFI
ncbi:uncharacterized protein ACMZJ9_006655 [Mantella aurantiaca]